MSTVTYLSDSEVSEVIYRNITIQTLVLKKGKYDVRSFKSQLITIGNTRTYLLDATKRDLLHTYFTVTPGCTITDDGHYYVVRDVWYYRKPKYVFLTVYRTPFD